MPKRKASDTQALLKKILASELPAHASLVDTLQVTSSVMALQRSGEAALMAQFPTLQASEVHRLQGRLDVASAAMMRAFREQRLIATAPRPLDERKGPLALSTGPTYENQFSPSWANNARPEAVDATTSPAAYLIDMLSFVKQYIEGENLHPDLRPLAVRRPDLFELTLDHRTLSREVPQVEVVNQVLERAIVDEQQRKGESSAVEDRLLQVRHPLRLFPYETYWQQILTVLAHNDLHLGDVARLGDLDNPYFIRPGAHSHWSDSALQQESELGPALRSILVERPYFGNGSQLRVDPQNRKLLALRDPTSAAHADEERDASAQFFLENFGVQGETTLRRVVSFCQVVQIDQTQMESLFALADHAPRRSDNVRSDVADSGAAAFGARFINSAVGEPVGVDSSAADPQLHYFLNLTPVRLDRINRFMRLAHALQLPYVQVDQVVCAIIDAEQVAASELKRRPLLEASPLWMSTNTLRGLGVFQFLRKRLGCSAEDFATLLSNMGVHGVGDTPSHFDRVFNSGAALPLVLDDELFSLSGDDPHSKRTIDQLCHGLGINLETFRYLSRTVMQAQGSETLRRSLPVISAFYRVTLLARLLSISTIELLSLLETLSPEGLYALQAAGRPTNAMHRNFSQTDTLSVVHAIAHCVLWCQQQDLPISWLVQQLLPIETVDVVPQATLSLLGDIKRELLPFQDLDQHLAEAGVMALRTASWQQQLKQIVDELGLFREARTPEEDFEPALYEQFLEREIQVVIDALVATPGSLDSQLPELAPDELQRLKSLILGTLLRVRSQQWGVVQERLAQALALSADRVIAVVYWAGGKVHALLESAARFTALDDRSPTAKAIMPLLQRMQRHARVAERLKLSPLLLATLLSTTQRPRLSLSDLELTLPTLYRLERYTHAVERARQSEEQLLGYWQAIAALGEMSENERRLIKDAAAEKIANWMGWGIREVLDVATHLTSDGIVRNLDHLIVLAQVKAISDRTGLSAISLMKLSRLDSHASTQDHRDAAQQMLSSLNRPGEPRGEDAELRQSLATRCVVSQSRLIANRPDESTRISLTLLDMSNQPVADIRVSWTTDLGTLLSRFGYTDHNGVVTVELDAGELMGVAHVKATYLLDSEAYAPPIVIDCDEDSLTLIRQSPLPAAPWQAAGNLGEYVIVAGLFDDYDNPGVDRLINWASDIGQFVDSAGETLTNDEGLSQARLRSMDPGQGRVAMWYAGSTDDPQILALEFEDRPSIRALALDSWAVVGTLVVKATVLSVNGEPASGQKLVWACTRGDGEDGPSFEGEPQTDEHGEARLRIDATEAGTLQVRVALRSKDDDETGFHPRELTLEVLPDALEVVTEQGLVWPLADGIDASDFLIQVRTRDGRAVERCPVTWTVQEGGHPAQPMTTDAQGKARFILSSTTPGPRTVVATWGEDPQAVKFDEVIFLPALDMQVCFDGQPIGGPVVIRQPAPGAAQDTYTLSCTLPADHPLLREGLQLLYDGRDSAPALGLSFEPGLGEVASFEERTVSWTLTAVSTGLSHESRPQLGITYRKASRVVWLDLIVQPAQP